MGFDKTKALNAAEKFLAQGKIAPAIQEYRKIVERDPADFTALNTLGDLYVRTKKEREALSYFLRVADHYREQGFALKAIAMYKKISRLQPDESGVAQHLARLYEQQGLYVEARAQYLVIANLESGAGRQRESLEALRRIADLDPKNVSIRLRLAEGYTREGMSHDAAGAYVETGELLLAAGKSHEALDAYKHAHVLLPTSHAVLHGLVESSTAVGAAAEAAVVLEDSIREAPGDLELRAMLARTYIEAEDAPAAERATDALVTAEHTNYPLWFEVARLHLKQSSGEDAVRVLARAIEPALTGKQDRTVLNLLDEALALDPDQIDALKLVLRIHTWHRDDEGLRVTLERLADAARRHGQAEEERRALEHLVRIVPFDQSYHERLSELGGAAESPAEPNDSRGEDSFTAAPNGHAGATTFDTTTFEHLAEFHADPSPDLASPQNGQHAATTEPFASGAAEFEWNAAEPARNAAADPSASFADLNDEMVGTAAEPTHTPTSSFDFAFESNGLETGEVNLDNPFAPTAGAHDAAAGESGERVQSLLKQELESVDFYLEQGYTDIARDTLDMLERQYGVSEETAQRRAQLSPVPADDATSSPGAESFADIGGFDLPAETPTEFSIDEQAFVVEAEEPGADERVFHAAEATQFEAAPRVEEASRAAVASEAEPARQERAVDPQLASIFGEFLDEADADEVPPSHDDDFETHYNLGVAYKEMCLWDEAVEQFQKAAELTAPADGTTHYLECCNMLGHCLTQKGVPRAAVLWFKRALSLPSLSQDVGQALRYDLASAYEQSGDIDRAIDTFSEVYGVDVGYRGVAERLRELQQREVASNK
ncbi:MAG: tetratricopeptide repeat protein [Pyrinomonadaceae bacterium]